MLEKLDGGGIAPVKILEKHDARRAAGQELERPRQPRDEGRLVGRGGAGPLLPVLRARRSGRQDRLQVGAQLGRHRLVGRHLPQRLDERLEGDAAVLVTTSGQARGPGELQAMLQLPQQAALADTARSRDQHQARPALLLPGAPGCRTRPQERRTMRSASSSSRPVNRPDPTKLA